LFNWIVVFVTEKPGIFNHLLLLSRLESFLNAMPSFSLMSKDHVEQELKSLSETYCIILSEIKDPNKRRELSDEIIRIENENPELYSQIKSESTKIIYEPYLCRIFGINYANPGSVGQMTADYVAYLYLQVHDKPKGIFKK
jgi:hypothetical protein